MLNYLNPLMPVDKFYLQYYDRDYTSMRSIAYADANGCQKMDLLAPLSDTAGSLAAGGPPDQDTVILENPEMFPNTQEIGKFYKKYATSLLIMTLREKSEILGYPE